MSECKCDVTMMIGSMCQFCGLGIVSPITGWCWHDNFGSAVCKRPDWAPPGTTHEPPVKA